MAAKTTQRLNEQENHRFDIYGIVSNGKVWEFGKYTTDNRFYKTGAYSLEQLDILLGVLGMIFAACDAREIQTPTPNPGINPTVK